MLERGRCVAEMLVHRVGVRTLHKCSSRCVKTSIVVSCRCLVHSTYFCAYIKIMSCYSSRL
jgi:hypothetical protein